MLFSALANSFTFATLTYHILLFGAEHVLKNEKKSSMDQEQWDTSRILSLLIYTFALFTYISSKDEKKLNMRETRTR